MTNNKPTNYRSACEYLISKGADPKRLFFLKVGIVWGVAEALNLKGNPDKAYLDNYESKRRLNKLLNAILQGAGAIAELNSDPLFRTFCGIKDTLIAEPGDVKAHDESAKNQTTRLFTKLPDALFIYAYFVKKFGQDTKSSKRRDESFRCGCIELVKYVRGITGKPHYSVAAIICQDAIQYAKDNLSKKSPLQSYLVNFSEDDLKQLCTRNPSLFTSNNPLLIDPQK